MIFAQQCVENTVELQLKIGVVRNAVIRKVAYPKRLGVLLREHIIAIIINNRKAKFRKSKTEATFGLSPNQEANVNGRHFS